MKHFKAMKTVKRGTSTTLVQLNSVPPVTILTVAHVELNYEQFLTIRDRKEAEAIVEVMTSYLQDLNGQTSVL